MDHELAQAFAYAYCAHTRIRIVTSSSQYSITATHAPPKRTGAQDNCEMVRATLSRSFQRSSKSRRSEGGFPPGNSRRRSAASGLWLLERSHDGDEQASSSVSITSRETSPLATEELVCRLLRLGQCLRAKASSGDWRSSHCPPLSDTSCRFSGYAVGEISCDPRRLAQRLEERPPEDVGGVCGGCAPWPHAPPPTPPHPSLDIRRCCWADGTCNAEEAGVA